MRREEEVQARGPRGEVLLPAIQSVVREIDIEGLYLPPDRSPYGDVNVVALVAAFPGIHSRERIVMPVKHNRHRRVFT